jgi:hypothetical protein
MSSLYPALKLSSPEVARLKKARLCARQFDRRRLNPQKNLSYVAVSKDAFPSSGMIAGRIKSFRLPKQAQVSSVIFQAQYQAFVRFAVASGAAV